MLLRSFTLSLTYSLGQIILGLLCHPFQTVQVLVRDKYWLWMAFFPIFIFVLGFAIWQGGWWLIFNVFSSTPIELLPMMKICLDLIKWWFFYFCLIWQVILLLLLIKFLHFYHRKK